MIDKKDPGHESVKADASDDEIIIDLTDEVITKAEDDNRILNLTPDMADDASEAAEAEKLTDAGSDEEILVLDDADEMKSPDDKVLIIDNSAEMEIDDPDTADAVDSAETRQREDAAELEEEMQPEDELDDDEENLLDLNLERSEDTPDFVDIVLDRSSPSDQTDDDHKPTQYLELETEELDDIVLPEDEQEDQPQKITNGDDAEGVIDSDELPDIDAISGLDFEEVDDDNDREAPDESEAFGSDDILAGAIRQTAEPVEDTEPDTAAQDDSPVFDEIENFPGLIDPHEVDQEVASLTGDEPLIFEEESDSLDPEEGLDPDIDDEVIPLDGFGDAHDDHEEDIIEITEFDQHFPAEGETLLKQTGILDPSGAEENDFLELIDVEDDILSEDQEVVEFSEPPDTTANESLNLFAETESEEDKPPSTLPDAVFSDEAEDRKLEEAVSGPDLKLPPEDERGHRDKNEPGTIEAAITPQTELPEDDFDANNAEETASDEALLSQDAEASTPMPDGPPDAALFPESKASEEIESDEHLSGPDSDVFGALPAGQIDAAIERVINEKFAGKIEDIIYDVIQKAVAKEISRLKGALLDDPAIDSESE